MKVKHLGVRFLFGWSDLIDYTFVIQFHYSLWYSVVEMKPKEALQTMTPARMNMQERVTSKRWFVLQGLTRVAMETIWTGICPRTVSRRRVGPPQRGPRNFRVIAMQVKTQTPHVLHVTRPYWRYRNNRPGSIDGGISVVPCVLHVGSALFNIVLIYYNVLQVTCIQVELQAQRPPLRQRLRRLLMTIQDMVDTQATNR